MRCPACGHADDKVVDSRLTNDSYAIRRRRECLGCGNRFSTYERAEVSIPMVVKQDGRRERFDRNKAQRSLLVALQKRHIRTQVVEDVLDRLERELSSSGIKEIQSRRIGDFFMDELRTIDEIAYIRFASVYRSFQDILEFMAEVDKLRSANNHRAGDDPAASTPQEAEEKVEP